MAEKLDEYRSVLADLEKASGASPRLDCRISTVLGEWWLPHTDIPGPWTASLDATIALVERVLPNVSPSVGQNVHHKTWQAYLQILGKDGEPQIVGRFPYAAATPPLALLTAMFRALVAKMEGA